MLAKSTNDAPPSLYKLVILTLQILAKCPYNWGILTYLNVPSLVPERIPHSVLKRQSLAEPEESVITQKA